MKKNQVYFLIAGIVIILIFILFKFANIKEDDSTPAVDSTYVSVDSTTATSDGDIDFNTGGTNESHKGNVDMIDIKSTSKLSHLDLLLKDLDDSGSKFEYTAVDMQIELAKIFSPDNFDCIEGKLKEKIKKLQVKGKDGKVAEGFVPKDVLEMVNGDKESFLIEVGANYLAHSFTYLDTKTNKESKLLVAGDAPSYEDFNLGDYMIKGRQDMPYLIYTMDCSGYFSAAVNASGGMSGNDIKTSASLTRNSSSNLVVITCVMNSPLFSAYSASKPLQKEDKATYLRRCKILKSVLKKLPSDNPNVVINLKENYYALLSSNSKSGSFNGSVNANMNAGIGFGFGSASANADGNGKLSRTMEFDKFKTYILDNSIGSEFRPISLKDFKAKITELEKLSK